MPRPTNFVSVVQKLVREQVEQAIHGLLGSATPKKEAKNGRRRPPAEAGEERMRGGAVVPRIRRLTPLATARPDAALPFLSPPSLESFNRLTIASDTLQGCPDAPRAGW